jgi:hypothetical protein
MKPRSLTTALLALLLASCGGSTAIELTLVADPNVNNTADLVQKLRSLKLVVSSDEGLYASPPASLGPDLKLDADGKSLAAERSVAGLDHLPRIRLEKGSMRPVALELRLEGNPCPASDPSCQALAAGGVKGVRFADGTAELQVPFNTRLYYRQPQVTQVNPQDGEDVAGGFDSIAVIFSKKMSPDSITKTAAVLRVLRVEAGTDIELPAKLITLTNLGGYESPALATFFFQAPLGDGTYRIAVSTGALDVSGRTLDQVPMQAGDQPFSSTFTVGRTPGPVMPTCNPCPYWCSEGGEVCAPGLACDKTSRTCTPKCPATCPAGNVCYPALGVCAPDCRIYGSYGGCASDETCQPTGLCAK